MTNVGKLDWIEQGFKLLASDGALTLTIDHLSSRLGLTKGSFYHHFKNFQDYKDELLTYFEEAGTLQIIRLTEEAVTPQAKIEKLLETTLTGHQELEVAIRAWALQDSRVQVYQQRIDKERLTYLQNLCEAILADPDRALLVARLLYTIFVGSQQIRPPLQADTMRQLYHELQQLYKLT